VAHGGDRLAQVGLRTAAMAMPLASFRRSVTAAAAASGTQGGPMTCGAKTPSRPCSSACFATMQTTGAGKALTKPQ